MKKFLLLAICGLMSVMGMAQSKTYTDNLVVTVNDESTEPQLTSVEFTDNGDGTCDFALNNFVLGAGDDMMGVGNIALKALPLTKKATCSKFEFNGNLEIVEGDDASVDTWLGPMLGEIPLVLYGEVDDDKLYVTIDIDMMESLEQIIYVKFGTDNIGYKPYTDNLIVSVNEESTEPQLTTVLYRNNGDGTCDFTLNNFVLGAGDDMMGVGNIALKGLTYSEETGIGCFTFDGVLEISNGDDASVDMWLGPLLGEIPLKLTGKVTDDKIYVTIDIDMMESLEQIIHVEFGDDNFVVAPTTYALTFVVDGVEVSTAELEEGATVVYPEVAEKEGYTFAWEGETVATMPAEALTIKGGYTVNSYNLSYYVNGYLVHTETVEFGAAVPEFGYELQEGYTFSGWDEEPATMPAHDVEVKATETVNTYKVTYMADGQVVATYEVTYGEAMPAAPEYKVESDDRYTRTFEGWEGEELTTMPAHDVTYTANINIVDAIHTVAASKGAVIYDAQGRRVSAVRSGLYIINGKKVLK